MRNVQLAVMDDLFAGRLDEQAILDKHNVKRDVYSRWCASDGWREEFNRRIGQLSRAGELIIARYVALAAAKLVALTESENQETARKACLDIISMLNTRREQRTADSPSTALRVNGQPFDGSTGSPQAMLRVNGQSSALSPALAGRLLAVLAEEKLSGNL